MTAAIIIALVFSAWSVALAVLGEKEKCRRTAKRCDLITALAGTAAVAVGTILTMSTVRENSEKFTADGVTDAIRVCYAIAFIVTGIFFVICSATSLMSFSNPKLRDGFPHRLRITMIAVSAVFVFSLALFGCLATSAYVGPAVFVSTAGLGLMIRYCSLIENKGR